MRPGFKEFIQYIRQGKGYLIVVYTASLHKWANKILMAINEILGYKFYCLQLTSMDCLPPFFDKSLINFQNELLKMGIDRRPDDFIMIDNNPVMTDKRLIIAPSYNLAPIKALQSMIDTKNITSNECRLHILQFDIQYFQEAPFRDNKNAVKDCYFMSLITTDFL